MALEVVHVLNGGFMDMMVNPGYPGIVNVQGATARIWESGEELFDLTTVADTARFTALLSADPADVSGVRAVSGAQTTFNAIVAETERLTGREFEVQILGDADDLRRITATAEDPWAVLMEWYLLSMITVPALSNTENQRFPELQLTSLHDYLTEAHAALRP